MPILLNLFFKSCYEHLSKILVKISSFFIDYGLQNSPLYPIYKAELFINKLKNITREK